ncbi:hypothetical protein MKY98_05765 [Paenibacillus sp. FSL M8-0228]|jgi:hypothetical protein|uniref:Uncharacterized protein n=2 Tax=Paenibacillus polymyxa TaxID=1406 RepID=A0A8I1ILY2_PAEPO|nr:MULTISPECIES: hypothetical protein [Paenibacillus]KAF6576383.1 hypothetical protein G9G53_00310 [Paenibacillus sp. EKM206P]KAF6591483.1 hypothetical protein G9G52_03655 [Paenibacillus sp. EKM205P]KEO80053.1 hypothetical protein EL23_00475 [Paenibacillus polymyxa]MBM0632177.1 hypothetical protein [Paenibacillus polymyxa]MBO3283503.1 hypothetical protein [Paenibacillus polymyxa]
MYKDPMSQADMEYKRYKALNPVEADDRRTADKTNTDDTSTEDNPRGVASANPEPRDQGK